METPDYLRVAPFSERSRLLSLRLSAKPRQVRFPEAWIVVVFAISRLTYHWAMVRFQTHILLENFQFIDVALLRTRLWESLFYFHMQPPLLNALAGLIVKSSPAHYGEVMHGVYMAIGLANALLLFRIMRYLQVGACLALFLTILFTINPGTVLWENFPCYEYIMMFLLLAWGVVFHKLIGNPGFWWSFTFFSLFAGLAWIRALYHVFFMLALIPLVAWFVGKNRKAVMAGSLAPLITVAALYVKNLVVFGFFGASSWFGFANATCTIHQLTSEEREQFIRRGELLEIARVEAPSPVPEYDPYIKVEPTGVPVLDQAVKSTGGINTNNLVYLKADALYRKASRQVLALAPRAYLEAVVIAWFCYFRPATDFFQFDELREPIRPLDRFVNIAAFGQFHEATGKGLRELRAKGGTLSIVLYTGTFLIVAFPLLLLWGFVSWRRAWRNGNKVATGLIAFAVCNILFIMMTTNFLSSFENNRYRFPSDCLYLILLGTFLQYAIDCRAAKEQRA
jgi:hypothetical protein